MVWFFVIFLKIVFTQKFEVLYLRASNHEEFSAGITIKLCHLHISNFRVLATGKIQIQIPRAQLSASLISERCNKISIWLFYLVSAALLVRYETG